MIFAGYATLPNKENDFLRKTVAYVLIFFAVISVAGFVFTGVTQSVQRPIVVNATIAQDLAELNAQFGLNGTAALTARLDDFHTQPRVLQYEAQIPLQLANNATLELRLDNLGRLSDVLRKRTDQAALNASCRIVHCDLSPSDGR